MGSFKFLESESLLWAGVNLEPLVSRKGDIREDISEGSETTKVGTDEQELDMRLQDRISKHNFVRSKILY